MRRRIQKWGKGLAFRIPKKLADELQWKDGTVVDSTLQNGKLVIETIPLPDYELEDLLKGLTPEHFQKDVETGPSVGKEIW